MAKINQPPGSQDNADLLSGRIIPVGVGLREGEVTYLDLLAAENGITRNALIHFAIHKFLLDFRAGKIDLTSHIETPPIPKRKLNLPK